MTMGYQGCTISYGKEQFHAGIHANGSLFFFNVSHLVILKLHNSIRQPKYKSTNKRQIKQINGGITQMSYLYTRTQWISQINSQNKKQKFERKLLHDQFLLIKKKYIEASKVRYIFF